MTKAELTATAEAMLVGMARRPAGMTAEEWLGLQIGAQIKRVLEARDLEISDALEVARDKLTELVEFINLSDEYEGPQMKAHDDVRAVREALDKIERAGR